jgi:SpoVK/Ycf46/Vps4 family AAA+-type ATPase
LDHAVLRRVPSRIYIGLPPKGNRVQIFKIYLKDEVLGADVDFEYLGQKSWRYSGSDIKSVFVQAALICDTIVSGDDPRRLLKQMHFEKAFQRSPATVSVKLHSNYEWREFEGKPPTAILKDLRSSFPLFEAPLGPKSILVIAERVVHTK